MRRILLFLFALQFITGNWLGEELCKMPNLIRHYRTHQRTTATATWSLFLRLHYAGNRHRHADPAHRQLPLQSLGAAAPLQYLLPDHPQALMPEIAAGSGRQTHAGVDALLPADFRMRLFRPPCDLFG